MTREKSEPDNIWSQQAMFHKITKIIFLIIFCYHHEIRIRLELQ